MRDKKIAFIGSGAMGEAMIAGLLRQGLATPEHLLTADVHAARVADLQARYGTRPFTDNREAAAQADLVVLSVKPQRLTEVLKGLREAIPPHALVLSIVAGAKITKIMHGLGHEAVIRSMPNTPAQISQGITVWMPSPAVTEAQKAMARQLLSALGKEIEVDDENYLDMATALSGTGPAYIFLFMEAMIDAGVHMGFSRQVSEQLVVETIKGSVAYFEARNHKDQVHVAALRNQVTSPGGTTAQALYYLEKAGFRTAVSRAIWAAYERSIELGKEKPVHIPESNSTSVS
ncbi:MAG: pyrroline-5-carboxylate reductase [Anaerolineales bacterium]|nr:pyrroline-5-carboxylate reductase [Anaerolineales bacterium]MCX7755729.1 pyrroline-5-carboxylate reductase [Anaerolineales bacterium]MDW8277670.1 pyrroline-5-carboxylate reductase [Anaerolineales bacterium]